MKRILSICLFIVIGIAGKAQEPIYLFDDFQNGRITMKPRADVKVKFNIDAAGQKIYYYQGDVLMELVNSHLIDTIFVNDRRFVWKENCLCEKIKLENGEVYVNWMLRSSYVGKEGAMGLTTQGKAETYYVPGLNSKYSLETRGKYKDETEVWNIKNENTYIFSLEGRECKVRRPKELYKAFPQYEEELSSFIRKNNLVMTNAIQAIRIIDYLMTLSVTRDEK